MKTTAIYSLIIAIFFAFSCSTDKDRDPDKVFGGMEGTLLYTFAGDV